MAVVDEVLRPGFAWATIASVGVLLAGTGLMLAVLPSDANRPYRAPRVG